MNFYSQHPASPVGEMFVLSSERASLANQVSSTVALSRIESVTLPTLFCFPLGSGSSLMMAGSYLTSTCPVTIRHIKDHSCSLFMFLVLNLLNSYATLVTTVVVVVRWTWEKRVEGETGEVLTSHCFGQLPQPFRRQCEEASDILLPQSQKYWVPDNSNPSQTMFSM